jgi:hypothetical protein
MAAGTAFRAVSLKSALKVHTAESLADDATDFYFAGVNKSPSGRKMQSGPTAGEDEIVYEMNLYTTDGEPMGTCKIARLSIAEQLEKAGVIGEAPDAYFGPVRIVKAGRTYRMEPVD